MDRRLQHALADVCGLLEEWNIAFAIVGGIAASLRGRLRATEDIDLIVLTDVVDVLRRMDTIESTPFRPLFPEFEKVLRTAYILALEHQPTNVTLDLAIGASGFEQQIVERATTINISGTMTHVATAEDLILMKLLAGRPQDQQDIAVIVAIARSHIDWNYCESVAAQLEPLVEIEMVKLVSQLKEK